MLKKEKVHQQLHRLEKKNHNTFYHHRHNVYVLSLSVHLRGFPAAILKCVPQLADDTLFLHDAVSLASLEPFENF